MIENLDDIPPTDLETFDLKPTTNYGNTDTLSTVSTVLPDFETRFLIF